jgi:predicted dehydrogenase
MSPPFRIAFIGIDHSHGAGWREIVSGLGEDAELVALVPGFAGATTSLEERYSHLPRFSTVEELIRFSAFDGAIVCLPNNEAPSALHTLAKAGKHVVAEKPGAASAAEFEPVADAVSRAGVAFQVGYVWRYDPGANRLRDMVRDGRFGKLISIEMTLVTSDVERRGVSHYLFDRDVSRRGFFSWLACHWLDLLPYVTGERVTAVTARLGNFGETPCPVEDGGAAILELSGGGFGTLVGGYWLPRWLTEGHWTIRGSKRWVKWDPNAAGKGGKFEIHGPQPQFHAMEEIFALPHDPTPGYGGMRTVELIRDWIAEARGEKGRCRCGIGPTLEVLRLLDTIYRASEEGMRVTLRG